MKMRLVIAPWQSPYSREIAGAIRQAILAGWVAATGISRRPRDITRACVWVFRTSQEGFLMRTPRGREVTPKAYEHLGKKPYGGSGTPLLFS